MIARPSFLTRLAPHLPPGYSHCPSPVAPGPRRGPLEPLLALQSLCGSAGLLLSTGQGWADRIGRPGVCRNAAVPRTALGWTLHCRRTWTR